MSEGHDKNRAPFGWYIGSYLSRFVEIGNEHNVDPESRFSTRENTVTVRAESLEEAYDKVAEIGRLHSEPYKGGHEAIDVQWVFEGVTLLLPIYEELEDGAELMWAERRGVKLKSIRAIVHGKSHFFQ